MTRLGYMAHEARQGMRRNAGAAGAAILVIFISLSIAGAVMLLNTGMRQAVGYLQSQVKIKLLVDPRADLDRLVEKLRLSGRFDGIEAETGVQMLDNMRRFFAGREHLLTAFQGGEIPSSVTLKVSPPHDMAREAAELERLEGIVDVIYPQAFAGAVLSWSRTINGFSAGAIATLLAASLLTVCVAINLALHQRRQDIRVKLLLGAREADVRAQFLLEGAVLGLVGGILASFVVYGLHQLVLRALQQRFAAVLDVTTVQLGTTMATVVAMGLLMGLAGSFVTTGRLIKDA